MKKIYSGQFIKNISFTLILFSSLSCATSQKLETIESSYNSAADIDLFLSTNDKKTEDQVLERLKLNNVNSSQIKKILQTTLPKTSQNKTGLQPNLKFKMAGKTYTYAL